MIVHWKQKAKEGERKNTDMVTSGRPEVTSWNWLLNPPLLEYPYTSGTVDPARLGTFGPIRSQPINLACKKRNR